MNFKKLTESYNKEMIETLKGFCGINSEFDSKTSSKENPYGEGVTKALNFFKSVADKDGFMTKIYDNRILEITFGNGDKNLTILGHADVVPAGEGWEFDPYIVKEENGILYGRGVSDDKGPVTAAYYALKALKDNNLLNGYKVRFLIGGDEERGSSEMHYYFDELHMPAPTLGFTPDASFPVIYGEKGILFYKASIKTHVSGLISIEGGTAVNAVISRCKVCYEKDEEFVKFALKYFANTIVKDCGDYYELTFIGKAAHGSVPWEGINAGIRALNIIAAYTRNNELCLALSYFSDCKAVGINAQDHNEEMGHNSLNVGFISYKNDELTLGIDNRYINTYSSDLLKETIKKNAPEFTYTFLGDSKLLYFPKDSILISTLLKAYQEETNDYEHGPIAIGGGTYAKTTSNIVAFGIEFPNVDYKMHSIGENIPLEHLYKGMAIYAHAIYELGKKLNEK